jgi:hypothetical protein
MMVSILDLSDRSYDINVSSEVEKIGEPIPRKGFFRCVVVVSWQKREGSLNTALLFHRLSGNAPGPATQLERLSR